MNTFKGPFRLLLKEMRPTFYINTLVTLVLMAFFIILGFWTESADNSTVAVGVIFGPYYAIFLAYPFIIFPGYRYILSLGGTRKQFMKAALMSAVLYVLLAMLILNGLHFLSESIVSFGNHSISFFHMADLVNGENPLLYLWVDILWCLFLFGVGMIAKSIWFNFGPLRTLMAVTGLLILGIAAVTFLDLSPVIEFMVVDHLLFLHLLAGISILFMLLSYLVMKNGPLERGGRKGLFEPRPTPE